MEYSKYLIGVKPNLLTISAYNPIVTAECEKAGIFGKFDLAKLEAERNGILQNQIFWNTIERKSRCWIKLIEIFRAVNEHDIVEVLEKGKRNDSKLNFYNCEPFVVKVTRRKVQPGMQEFHSDNRYEFEKDHPAGMALVINITEFDEESKNRAGAKEDFRYMKNLWQEFGYIVKTYDGKITENNLKVILEEFLNACAANQAQSCVVFIGSHGDKGNIALSDGKEIRLYDDFIKKFNDDPILKGKPKLFFVQSCQHFPTGSQTGAQVRSELKDTLVSFSTLPGEPANRHEKLGSYFVYALTRVFMEHACRKEIKELLSDVSQAMIEAQEGEKGKTQVSTFDVSDGMRPFYFNLTEIKLN